MNLARFSLGRPVTASIISIALFVLGLFFLKRMPVSLYPEVSIPWVSIVVPFPGAEPEQIEAKIIKPLEKELGAAKKLSRMISFSRQNYGTILLGFKASADDKESVDIVREKVARIKGDFPAGSKEAQVQRVDVGATPVLIYGIESNNDPAATKDLLDVTLVKPLERTEGVGEARVVGLGDERLEVQLNPQKLQSLRVAPLDIYEQFTMKLGVVPWGELTKGGHTMAVGRGVPSDDPQTWRDTIVTLKDARGIRLGEVADVVRSRDEKSEKVLVNGKPGLGLVITKRSDANTLNTVDAVKTTLQRIVLPSGVQLFPIIDQSAYIKENAHEVWIAIFVGGAFAVLVILLFLTDIKSALISATALPVSIAGSFIFMSALGFSINMMSLLAVSLAIGLLIDDAVVVRESIYAEMEHGAKGAEAALRGTDKVFAAVLATTLSIVAVFLPVGVMQGIVGQFFREFGVTIVIATVISTWVAFTLDPLLSARFAGELSPLRGAFWDSWRRLLAVIDHGIATAGRWGFRHPVTVLLVALGALVGTFALTAQQGADFLAFEDRGQFSLDIRTPSGTPREKLEAVVSDAAARLKDLEGLKEVYATVGVEGDDLHATMRYVFTPKTKRKTGLLAIQEQARQKLAGLDASFLVMDPPPIEGVGGEAPVTISIYGEDLVELRAVTNKFLEQVRQVKGIAEARIDTADFTDAIDISYNHNNIGLYGTTAQAVELSGRLAFFGLEPGQVGIKNRSLWLKVPPAYRSLNQVQDQILVPTQRGPTALGEFVTSRAVSKPSSIEREGKSRKVTISGTLNRHVSYQQVLDELELLLKKLPQPFFGELAGDRELFEDMVSNFSLAILGSLFFIFVILSAQFENIWRPFVILLSLPLAVIGGLLALWIFGLKLALGALIGMVLLMGLAAKNGILLVDAIGQKEQKMPLEQAVVESVHQRSRAILMTSIAMIFGMIPTAVMRGDGSEFRSPMALSIIGGVISSTLLSFLVIPAIFGLLHKVQQRWRSLPSAPGVTSVLLVGALTAAGAMAFPHAARASESAHMPTFCSYLVKARFAPEEAVMRATQSQADEASRAAHITFLGGVRIEAGHTLTRPGITQSNTLPLPDALGGPVSLSTVIVPQNQNTLTLGWEIPLINLQAIYGLRIADALHNQAALVSSSKKEDATLKLAEQMMKLHVLHASLQAQKKYVELSQERLTYVQARRRAGMAPLLEEAQAEATLQVAVLKKEQDLLEYEKLKAEIEEQAGTPVPVQALGATAFPYQTPSSAQSQGPRTFGLDTLKHLEKVQLTNIDIIDAGFYPQIIFEIGHQRKYFAQAPDPQTQFTLKARWDVLDGGTRLRNRSREWAPLGDLRAQVAEATQKLRARWISLPERYQGVQRSLTAAKNALGAAQKAQGAAQDAYKAGLAKSIDVREADRAVFESTFALIQLQAVEQGLALESLYLNQRWLNYLQGTSAP